MSRSSIFFCVCIFFFALLFCVPLKMQFVIKYQKQWNITWNVKIFFWNLTLPSFSSNQKWMKKAEAKIKTAFEEQYENEIEHAVQIAWKTIFSFSTLLKEVLGIVAKRLRLEHLRIQCEIGWKRADYTAYSYGLFWALLSLVPNSWLEQSEICYIPNFRCQRQDIMIQGIISCAIGNLIGIVFVWFRLTIKWMLEQKRKEKMVYENGLCRWFDGNGNGEY